MGARKPGDIERRSIDKPLISLCPCARGTRFARNLVET